MTASAKEMETFRRAMTGRTDDELRKAVTIEADQYLPEALEAAWAELRQRGIEDVEQDDLVRIEKEEGHYKGVRWLRVIMVCIGLDVLGGVLLTALLAFGLAKGAAVESMALGLVGALVTVAVGGAWITFLIALFIGLWKRRLWGFHLHWVYLGITVLRMGATALTQEGVVSFAIYLVAAALGWGVPNYLYFRNRRYLFE